MMPTVLEQSRNNVKATSKALHKTPKATNGWAMMFRKLREQLFQLAFSKTGHERCVLIERGLDQSALLLLKGEDALLHGATHGESIGGDDTLLADAVGAVDGLGFDGGVPPRIE